MMKSIWKYCLLATIVFTACQKELGTYNTSTGILTTGGGDSCTGAVVSGTYKKTVPLVAANTASIALTVAAAGSYNIGTDTVNGIYFLKTSVFNNTGLQTVILNGYGTPADTGWFRFTVRYGTSSCRFSVHVDTGSLVVVVPPTGTDYFPTTALSKWSYDSYNYDTLGAITWYDSTHAVSTGATTSHNGKSYNVFTYNEGVGVDYDTAQFRKNGGNYYVISPYMIPNPPYEEGIFLKDNVAVGSSWNYTVVRKISATTLDTLIEKITILEKAVPVIINGISFPDVIKVGITEYPASSSYLTHKTAESWYARGVGSIYNVEKDSYGHITYKDVIRHYKVY